MDAAPSRLQRPGVVFARFSTVSVVSTALTLVVIALLTDLGGMSNAGAAALATLCGFICSYPMIRTWVFAGGPRTDHLVAVLWLGGPSAAGVVLSAVAGAGIDAVAASAQLDPAGTLAGEEITESVVLGAIFVVRFLISRALFDVPARG